MEMLEEHTTGPGAAVPPLTPVTLRTARLTLRPWTDDDIPRIHEICQDPGIQRWVPLPSPYRLTDAEWYVREYVAKGFATGDEATFAITVTDTGQIAGTIGLMRLNGNPALKTGEVGFWANPETRGRGYMTEAVREVARWGFEELGVRRIYWQAYDGNAASLRVAEKAGFTVIGKQRGSHLHRGEVVDMWLADLLPADLRP